MDSTLPGQELGAASGQGTETDRESLAKLQSDLKSAEKELDALSQTVSHDLRACLRVISVSVHEVLTNQENVIDPSSKGELIKIGDTVRQMGHLIDRIMRVTALTRAPVKIEELDLSYLADQVARDVAQRHSEKDVAFTVEPNVVVNSDERLLTAVLESLIENAYRVVGQGGGAKVEVGTSEVNDKITYWVKDNGPGFPPQMAMRIFEPREKIQATGGQGVSLTAVRRIIDRLGGKIWAQSQPGKGATFVFTLGSQG